MRDVLQRFVTVQPVRSTPRIFFLSQPAKLQGESNSKVIQQRSPRPERIARADVKTTIMCIGSAGMGIGSRFKGHARRGGQQFRKRHWHYLPVAMSNEYMFS
ncbi:hypothetical protein DFQ28_008034 [Apophysomyces sp. BC1034]|nr:hypothetical protein DFQ29_010007 [Apophysomyces sp. BC1021]KAG0186319.1 hypothetical protein DFQ28_008034 [Apophysomyces sp. BC1034]